MEWININELVPEIGQYVLVYTVTPIVFSPTGKINIREYGRRGFGIENVTHWQPLPEPPHQPKLVWQRSTKAMPDIWITSTDDEHEVGKYLTKFNWRQKEI